MTNWISTRQLGGYKILSLAALLAIGSAIATGVVITQVLSQQRAISQSSLDSGPINPSEIGAVAALGRLEPDGEVIQVSAPREIGGTRVEQLLVKQGDKLRSGQVIAILDNHDRLQADLGGAQTHVKIAKAYLQQVQAGEKQDIIQSQAHVVERSKADLQGQIATQDAAIARLKAELNNASIEFDRYEHLYQEGAISASLRDNKQLMLEMAQQRLAEANRVRQRLLNTLQDRVNEAKATLKAISQVRPTDVAVAQAELENAEAGVGQAQANLDLAYVRAPRDGQVLTIHTFPGETVANEGIVSLGQTNQMYVVAEVYETDIHQIQSGQRASITSRGFTGTLHGTVDELGLEVAKKDVLQTDPTADVDARVVEVKIRLSPDDSPLVSGLTNLQVHTIIHTK
ncbi:ABC exporter membrane fusion protein [Leptothoe spongobia]|uniref:ABC exporter membrane fusion protein n=1 Tax=Leptothoe spongobia TAU-MAC 1115 TaxID=1967444 RepID=A0A947DE46_9CYAN|nr:ABC exporter membrane fusion protein [Leptothoe spongobia]MBT9314699.1 ABC exporter membrane fusion protein [Leptothoe spongobia TAU-MAC 1115]